MVVLSPIVRLLARAMTPATSKTTIFLEFPATALRNEPGPLSLRFVTLTTEPPRPPVTKRPCPSAPGNAGAFSNCACAAIAIVKATSNEKNFFIVYFFFLFTVDVKPP